MASTAIQTAIYTIAEIVKRTGGSLASNPAISGKAKDNAVTSIAIDSRDCAAGCLFVALAGDQADGHDYVGAAVDAGAVAALVSRPIDGVDCAQIVVPDTLQALGDLAVAARLYHQLAGGHLVGITGSVGKTGTKEMLAHILRKMTGCHASKASFNNHIGVPLTIAALPEDMPVAIQEMGMNAPGEIADLTLIALPDVAVITRIADSHAGFFTDLSEIAAAKAEIFDGLAVDGIAVLNRDDEFFDDLSRRANLAGAVRIISFGQHEDAEFRLIATSNIDQKSGGIAVSADIAGTPLFFTLGMHAPHHAMNAIAVLAVINALGLDVAEAAALLADFGDLAGRGAVTNGNFGGAQITVIDDSYNAGPASMVAGLAGLGAKSADILVLSDMLELGDTSATAHDALAGPINAVAPRAVIAIGPHMHTLTASLDTRIDTMQAADSDAAFAHLETIITNGDRIFIKGSHGSGSWRVAASLLAALDQSAASEPEDAPLPQAGEAPHAA